MCSYVMNVFLAGEAPASFMNKMGWVFMGIACVNILTNAIILLINKIYNGFKSYVENKN